MTTGARCAAHLLMCCAAHLLVCCAAHLLVGCVAHLLMWCAAHLLVGCAAHLLMCCAAHLLMCCARGLTCSPLALVCGSAAESGLCVQVNSTRWSLPAHHRVLAVAEASTSRVSVLALYPPQHGARLPAAAAAYFPAFVRPLAPVGGQPLPGRPGEQLDHPQVPPLSFVPPSSAGRVRRPWRRTAFFPLFLFNAPQQE